MSKRVADKQLTDRNWEDEEEAEEAGIFAKAPENVIKQRVIKTAKRRVTNANGDSKPSLFAGFAGFGATQQLNVQPSLNFPKIGETNGDTKPLFSFSSKSDDSTAGDAKPLFSFGSKTEGQKATESSLDNDTPRDTPRDAHIRSDTPRDTPQASTSEENNTVFLRKLKKLNHSVIKFATEHVEKNAFVILTSVFTDYEKHLEKLQSEQPRDPHIRSDTPRDTPRDTSAPDTSPQFKISKTPEETPKTPEETRDAHIRSPHSSSQKPEETFSNPFSFGSASPGTAPAFSFGAATKAPTALSFGSSEGSFSFKPTTSPADSTQSSLGFSFKPATTGTPLSTGTSLFGKPAPSASFSGFGGLVGKPADSTENKEPEEEEATPVPEKVDHVDSEALYHIKCKLFLKAGDGWNEKGLGIANLKECNGKVQLLIRNDTTMGTVLLNTLLHDSMPVSKTGRNSLLLVATNEDAKTETYLCRVNKDKVEEFYDILQEYKKGAPSSTT